MAPDTLASISLVNTSNQPEIFARKVVVIAYTIARSVAEFRANRYFNE